MEDFKIVESNGKLDLLMVAINKINTNFHHKLDDMRKELADSSHTFKPRLDALQKEHKELLACVDDLESNYKTVQNLITRIEDLESQNTCLADDVEILKGIVQVQDKQLKANNNKITDLTAHSMANNITISGLTGDSKDENCVQKVCDFLWRQMKMNIKDEEVQVAHRIGISNENRAKPRIMVVRCATTLRARIFDFTKNLKDVVNEAGDKFFVNQQLPEPLSSQKKEREAKLHEICQMNAQLAPEEEHKKVKTFIKNKTLFINKKPQKEHIHPPTLQEVFNTDKNTKGKMDLIKLVYSSATIEKQRVFMGHAARVKNTTEAKLAYRKMKILYPECDHIVMAYTVKQYQGHADHGEYGAGLNLSKCLELRGCKDTILFVTREYGGIHLGQRHHIIIEKVAREALNSL